MDPLTIGTMVYEYVGTVDLHHKNFICSDPCYQDQEQGYTAFGLPCRMWDVWVLRQDCDDWGWRNGRLILTREGMRPIHEYFKGTRLSETIGVDSGTAGFFDIEAYGDRSESYLQVPFYRWKEEKKEDILALTDKEKWFRMCADRTLSRKSGVGLIPNGVVSSAGLGDGCYELWEMSGNQAVKATQGLVSYPGKEAVQFTLVFLPEDFGE